MALDSCVENKDVGNQIVAIMITTRTPARMHDLSETAILLAKK